MIYLIGSPIEVQVQSGKSTWNVEEPRFLIATLVLRTDKSHESNISHGSIYY